MRIFAVVEYNGQKYQGWQKQKNAPTIQEEIENALTHILNTQISIFASGRTDAGVHAKGQTFHFDVDKKIDVGKLRYSANCLLPNDIHILSMEVVDEEFHSRFSAIKKSYQYKILLGERSPFLDGLLTNIPYDFDIELFKKAMNEFVGIHNFQDFTSKEEDEAQFIREIHEVKFKMIHGNQFTIELIGNGFMRYMIRDIIGTALAVASGKENIDFIKKHLQNNGARDIVCYKAPADGLYLYKVFYK